MPMAAKKRGFAAMDPEKQRAIARKGGKAAHDKGTAHEFTPDEARHAGRKGGHAVSRDRKHMSDIGRQGGEAVSRDRDHMAKIGREGGEARASATMRAKERTDGDDTPENDEDQARDEDGERPKEKSSRAS